MLDETIVQALKVRYLTEGGMHPLVFHRSVERAETSGELFDILDSVPDYPFIWDEESRSWQCTKDLIQSNRIGIIQGTKK